MKRAVTVSMVCLAALIAGNGPANASRPSAGERMNGFWQAPQPSIEHETEVHESTEQSSEQPPDPGPSLHLATLLKPWAREIHQKYEELVVARRKVALEAPTLDNMCLPVAIPAEGAAAYGFPLQILSTPNRVVILMQLDHQMRIIRIGGQHPASLKPSWYGDSIGHWEGDTLVVDTIGYNERSEIQEFPGGWPHTEQLHTIERYQVAKNGKKIDVTYIYDDPGALTSPFISKKILLPAHPYEEFSNAENNREFPCPTAEAGTTYRPLSVKNLDELLVETKKLASPGEAKAPESKEPNGADTLPGNRDAVQVLPGKPFVPFPGGGPPPWDSGPLAEGPSTAIALEAAQAAIESCGMTAGVGVAASVLDTAGQPKAMLVADGVRGWHIYSATHKALTGLTFGKASSEVAKDVAAHPDQAARLKPNMTTLPGGVPLIVQGKVIGAIGVSGAKSGEQDEACASTGAAIVH